MRSQVKRFNVRPPGASEGHRIRWGKITFIALDGQWRAQHPRYLQPSGYTAYPLSLRPSEASTGISTRSRVEMALILAMHPRNPTPVMRASRLGVASDPSNG